MIFFRVLILCFIFLSFVGCSNDFTPLFKKSQHAFEKQEYIIVIYTLNIAFRKWKKADGDEQKGQAYQLLGKAYKKLNKIDQSMEAFEYAMALSDNTYDAATNLGISYLAASQPQLALKAYQNALRMKEDDPLALLGLGDCFFVMKDYTEAALTYEKVLHVSPGVSSALENLKIIKQKLKRRKKKR